MSIQVIWDYIHYAFVMGIPVFGIWSIWRVRQLRTQQHQPTFWEECTTWVLVFYLIFLYMITVFRQELNLVRIMTQTHDISAINHIPFIELTKLWGYGYIWSFTYNVLGNIIWFMPLGMLLAIKYPQWSKWRIIRLGTLISFSIELLQFCFMTGIADVDDLILNTIGTWVGYWVYQSITKMKR